MIPAKAAPSHSEATAAAAPGKQRVVDAWAEACTLITEED
jgi:hypothetical protein